MLSMPVRPDGGNFQAMLNTGSFTPFDDPCRNGPQALAEGRAFTRSNQAATFLFSGFTG